MWGKNEETPSTRHGKVVAKTKVTTKQGCHRSYDDHPLSGFIHNNNAGGTTDLSRVLSARRICSCSTKKPHSLQSLFDTWLTRFQLRIDKMCTNLYKFCKKKIRTLICDIHHSEQEFTRTKLQNKWIATVVDDGNYVMHQKAIISHQLQVAIKPPQNNVLIHTLILWKMVEWAAVPQLRVQFFVLLFDIEKLLFVTRGANYFYK